MRIALTGASGFLGSNIARHLAAAGHSITALVRTKSRRDHIAPFIDRFIEGDHANESCWPALLEGAGCIIHNSIERSAWEPVDSLDLHLQSNLVSSIKLLRASSPRQFIFLSTLSVHRDVPQPQPEPGKVYALPGSYYAAYKAALEAHIVAEAADGRPAVIHRPASVYGIDPNLKRSRGYDLLQSLRRLNAAERFSQPGWGRWAHIDDVAAAVTATVGNPAATGRACDLVDCYATHADWARLAAEVLGINVDIDITGSALPQGRLSADAARALGIPFNRGLNGIREHLAALARASAD